MAENRVTQEVVEAVLAPDNEGVVTQVVVEALVLEHPPGRVTSIGLEALVHPPNVVELSQFVMEVVRQNFPLIPDAQPSTARAYMDG